MLKYRDLTPAQKEYICNGCGGKGGWIKPPNFIFKASCNHHDFKFWQGATKEDFIKANKDFYDWMRVDIKESSAPYLKQQYFKFWAFSYMKAVSCFSKKYFSFCETKKTLEDLNTEMKNYTI